MWPARRSPTMLLVALALNILVALVAAVAQPRPKPSRIAFLEVGSAPPPSGPRPVVATFHAWLDRSRLMDLSASVLRQIDRRIDAAVAVSEAAASFARHVRRGPIEIVPKIVPTRLP